MYRLHSDICPHRRVFVLTGKNIMKTGFPLLETTSKHIPLFWETRKITFKIGLLRDMLVPSRVSLPSKDKEFSKIPYSGMFFKGHMLVFKTVSPNWSPRTVKFLFPAYQQVDAPSCTTRAETIVVLTLRRTKTADWFLVFVILLMVQKSQTTTQDGDKT